jgi:hypothetical protein
VETAGTICFNFNPLTPELNPSAQRCLPIFFSGDFKGLTAGFFISRSAFKV